MIAFAVFMILLLVLGLCEAVLKIYGIILSFQKKWYIGVVALVIPGFAEIIALAKLVFKKDLLT